MMHYAQVVFQAEKLGCDPETARTIARKIITTAALLAVMPEDVFNVWSESRQQSQTGPGSADPYCYHIENSAGAASVAPRSETLQILQSIEL